MASDDSSIAGRIKRLRERVKRRETATRADRRAKARKRQKRRERVRQRNPETRTEGAAAAALETGGLIGDLFSTTATVAEPATKPVAKAGSKSIDAGEKLASVGDRALQQIDTDGDGDTDILRAVEAVDTNADGRPDAITTVDAKAVGNESFEPPVGEIEDDFDAVATTGVEDDLRQRGGVEAELGLDFPLEGQ